MNDELSIYGRAAIDYQRRGLAVIALVPNKKKPSFARGLLQATTSQHDAREWWTQYPDDGVAIACGEVSGNVGVIDIDYDDDTGKDGYEYLATWEREHGELPETWSVKTARGGCHLYYRFKGEVPLNSTNEDAAVDFRGNGGYVVAPPSIHPNGRAYSWENHPDEYDLAIADENVLAFLDSIRPNYKTGGDNGASFELPKVIRTGERDELLFRYACSLQSRGLSDSEIETLVTQANDERCEKPLPRAQVQQKIKSALRYDKGAHEEEKHISKPEKIGLDLLAKNKRGQVEPTTDNHALILEHDPALTGRFMFDVMANQYIVELPVPWDASAKGRRPLLDSDYVGFLRYCERSYNMSKKQACIDALEFVSRQNEYNPLTAYLDGLEWDGESRIPCVLPFFLGAKFSDYNIEAMKVWLLGAVARAYEPGIKFDYMLVLLGSQGLGKSSFLSQLATFPEWFTDGVKQFQGDETIEKLRGFWIVELGELDAIKSARSIEQVKSFITTQYDNIRPKYGRRTETRPRRCVFAGSTNSEVFLSDRTGNRRFLPIECEIHPKTLDPLKPNDETRAYIQQVWAEAVHIWKTERPRLVLPESVMAEVENIRKRHMEDDPREGQIIEYLDRVKADITRDDKAVCVAEICEKALEMEKRDYNGNRRLSNEITEIMKHNVSGWTRCQKQRRVKGYGPQCVYIPDEQTVIEETFTN